MSRERRQIAELPDPFVFNDGSRVQEKHEWEKRRKEIFDTVPEIEYGGLPPTPRSLDVQRLHTHREKAAYEVYRFLGAEDRIGHVFRSGGHDHNEHDWTAFLDFAQAQLQGREVKTDFNKNPFPDQVTAFSWCAP